MWLVTKSIGKKGVKLSAAYIVAILILVAIAFSIIAFIFYFYNNIPGLKP